MTVVFVALVAGVVLFVCLSPPLPSGVFEGTLVKQTPKLTKVKRGDVWWQVMAPWTRFLG